MPCMRATGSGFRSKAFVATLLDEAPYHIQHLRLGIRGTITDTAERATTW
jgi:hypothetical protein